METWRGKIGLFLGKGESLTNLQVGRAECGRRGGILRIGRVSSLSTSSSSGSSSICEHLTAGVVELSTTQLAYVGTVLTVLLIYPRVFSTHR